MLLEDRYITWLAAHRNAWRFRRWLHNTVFRISRGAFRVEHAAEEATTRVRVVPILLRNAVLPVLLALALVVAMDQLNDHVHHLIKGWHWAASINASAYDVLLEATAGTTGVFLALYFTAVSTVAASVYVSVPHDIRSLLVRDRASNVYVSGVAFTMALAVLLLIANTLTGRTYWLAPPVIGLFAAFSIFAFIRLGQRAFYLADPTRLALTIAQDFAAWFRRAQAGKRRSWDPRFQEECHRQSRASLASLMSLLAIANDQPHLRGGSLRQLSRTIIVMLAGYVGRRDYIPTTSRWFGERYEHKQWYLAESTEVESATTTATTLQPRVVPDIEWVEEMVLRPLVGLVNSDLEHADYEGAYSILEQLSTVWQRFGGRWDASMVTHWTTVLASRITEGLANVDASKIARPALIPGIWDVLSLLPLASELTFNAIVENRTPDQLADAFDHADWTDRNAPYRIHVPREVIGFLEGIEAGRKFEDAVDAPSATRTPNWYVRETALNIYETEFKEQVDAYVALLTSWYADAAQSLFDAQQPHAAGAVLSRAVEVAWKLERHLERWEQFAAGLRRKPLLLDLRRPSWDWLALHEKISEFRTRILGLLGNSIKHHAALEPDSEMPDFFGQAVHILGEGCVEAVQSDNAQLFGELFPTYFAGVLEVVTRIQAQVADWDPQRANTAMAEPVVDLLDISGYALIYSEFHHNPVLWQTCESSWLVYAQRPGGRERLTIVGALNAFQRNVFAITHRATLRTRWEMALSQTLSNLPRGRSQSLFHPGPVLHESALIRRISPTDGFGYVFFHASDIFIVRFLLSLPEAAGLHFGVPEPVVRELENLGDDAEEDGE